MKMIIHSERIEGFQKMTRNQGRTTLHPLKRKIEQESDCMLQLINN